MPPDEVIGRIEVRLERTTDKEYARTSGHLSGKLLGEQVLEQRAIGDDATALGVVL